MLLILESDSALGGAKSLKFAAQEIKMSVQDITSGYGWGYS